MSLSQHGTVLILFHDNYTIYAIDVSIAVMGTVLILVSYDNLYCWKHIHRCLYRSMGTVLILVSKIIYTVGRYIHRCLYRSMGTVLI